MDRQQRISAAREIVTKYLHGEIDLMRNPVMFDDDIVPFAVARLDRHDLDWLLAQLSNPQWPSEIRADIAAMMPGHHAEGQAALAADDH